MHRDQAEVDGIFEDSDKRDYHSFQDDPLSISDSESVGGTGNLRKHHRGQYKHISVGIPMINIEEPKSEKFIKIDDEELDEPIPANTNDWRVGSSPLKPKGDS